MPRDEQTLDQGHRAEQRQSEKRQQEDAGKGEIGAHIAGDDLDVEAEALIAADEFGNGGANRRVDRRILEADSVSQRLIALMERLLLPFRLHPRVQGAVRPVAARIPKILP